MDVYVATIHIFMQILIVYGPPPINWQAVGRCPTLPALGKTCMHLVSCVKRLLCFTSKPYPGMHWLLCLFLFCFISRWHILSALGIFPSSKKCSQDHVHGYLQEETSTPCKRDEQCPDSNGLLENHAMQKYPVILQTAGLLLTSDQNCKHSFFNFQPPGPPSTIIGHYQIRTQCPLPTGTSWSGLNQFFLLYSKHPPRCEHPPGRNQLLAALPLQDHENDLHSCATEAIWYHQSTWQLYSWQKQ